MGAKPGRKKPEGAGKKAGSTVKQLSDADYAALASEIIDLRLAKAYDTWTINKFLGGKGLSYSQSLKVQKQAAESLRKIFADRQEDALTTAIAKLESMMMDARSQHDMNTALNCQKELNKLMGLHTTKIEVSGALSIPSVIEIVSIKTKED